MSILDYIEKIKRENEGPRITAQEPRNMAQGGIILPPEKPKLPQLKIFADKLKTYLNAGAIKKDYATQLLKDKMEELGVSDAELGTITGRRGEADGGRIELAGGGWLWKLLYRGKPGLQHGAIERKLRKEYIKTGMDKFKAYDKAMHDASDVVDQKKLKIVQDQMKKTNIQDDEYVVLIDEHIRLNDYEMYKDIKRWDSTRPDLADKTRALHFPDWAEARFGEDYHGVLQRQQARALRENIDPNFKEPLSSADQMVSDIDEMNKANIAEIFEGKKKHADGGRIIGKPGGLVEPGVEYYSTSKVYNEKTGHIYPGGNVHGKWWSDKPGRNQSPKILNDPDYIKILKERIGDPKYKNKNYKDLVREKVITDREYRALTKLGIDAQFIGKHYSDVKAKARAEAEKKWFKKYSKPSIESKTRGTTDIHKHHAGALRERVTTETTMPLEARINVKEIRKFENAINDIQNRQYKNNLNRSLPASKKKLVFEALAKEEAALRAANPEFSPYKSSLVFEESALGKGTFKFKEVMEKPELTVSEGKTGQKIAYKSATEKETQKIIDLTKDFMENRKLLIEKAKANAALKTAKKGGFGKQVKEICGLAKGGRIGFALGPDSCPLIESDPKRFLNEIVKVDKGVVGKFFKTPQAAKFAKNIARSALSVANPTTWIGGEAFYVGLEGMNSHSKGVPWLEAFDDAFIFYDFERVNKNIEDIASKMNLDENSMALLKNTMNINKLDSDMGKVQSQLEMVESDPLSEIDVGSSHKRIDEIKGQLDNEIQSYMSNVGKLFNKDPNTLDDSEIYKGFDILSNVFRKKVLTERQDAYKDIATRADPLAGNLGNWLNTNLFNLDVWKPQHLLTTKLTPQQEKQKYLDEIGNEFIPGTKIPNPKYNPRELYLYNKDARNLTYDSPLVDEALALRSEGQNVLGTGWYSNKPYASGGRAGYMGGGITGIRKPSAIAPTGGPMHQGLRSLYINDKDY